MADLPDDMEWNLAVFLDAIQQCPSFLEPIGGISSQLKVSNSCLRLMARSLPLRAGLDQWAHPFLTGPRTNQVEALSAKPSHALQGRRMCLPDMAVHSRPGVQRVLGFLRLEGVGLTQKARYPGRMTRLGQHANGQ
jgi:hypothetical protein